MVRVHSPAPLLLTVYSHNEGPRPAFAALAEAGGRWSESTAVKSRTPPRLQYPGVVDDNLIATVYSLRTEEQGVLEVAASIRDDV